MAVDLATLAIKVTQDGVQQAKQGLDDLARSGSATERAMGQVGTASVSTSAQIMKLAGAVTALYGAYKSLSDIIAVGMKMETMNVVMEQVGKNVGISTDALKYFTTQVASSGITTSEAMSTITKAMQMGLNLNTMKEFASRVRDVAVGARDAEGNLLNTSQTLGQVMQGLASGQTEILRNLGLQGFRTMEVVYKEYAASIGKTKDELNSAQKAQAMFNEFMRASEPLAGAAAAADSTVGKQLASMARYSETAKQALWDLFKPGMEAGVVGLTNAFKELKTWADTNNTSLNALGLQVGTFVGQTASAGLTTARWAASNFELLKSLAELYIISKAVAWITGLTTAIRASETATILWTGVTRGLIPVLSGAAISTTVFSGANLGAATAMTSATIAGKALNSMMVTLIPNIMAVVFALGAYGAYKTFKEPGQLTGPTASGDPFADIAAGPRDKDIAEAKAAQMVGPPVPSDSVLQMNRIMDNQKKFIQEANEATAKALSQSVTGKTGKAGGGGSSATESAEKSVRSFIETMNQATAQGAGDTEAILQAWKNKQLQTLSELAAKGADTAQAKVALNQAVDAKQRKLDDDFNKWYIQGMGDQTAALKAEEEAKLKTVAGNEAKMDQVREVYRRKNAEQEYQIQTNTLNLFKGYLDTMASLNPTLEGQLALKRQSLDLELKLADAALKQQIEQGKIKPELADQALAWQALVAQAKKFNLEMENNKGLGGWAAKRVKFESEKNTWADVMEGAEGFFEEAWTQGIQGALSKTQVDFIEVSKTMAISFGLNLGKQGIHWGFTELAKGILGDKARSLMGQRGESAARPLYVKDVGIGHGKDYFAEGLGGKSGEFGGFEKLWDAFNFGGDILDQESLDLMNVLDFGSGALDENILSFGEMFAGSTEGLLGASSSFGGIFESFISSISSLFGGGGGGILDGILGIGETVLGFFGFHGGGLVAHQGLLVAHNGLANDERLVKVLTGEPILQRSAMDTYSRMGITFDDLNNGRLPAVPVPISNFTTPAPAPQPATSNRTGGAINQISISNYPSYNYRPTQRDMDRDADMMLRAINKKLAERGQKKLGSGRI